MFSIRKLSLNYPQNPTLSRGVCTLDRQKYKPGNTKINTAAKAPRSSITTPILGINTAKARVAINHTIVVVIRRRRSWLTIVSGLNPRKSVHRHSKAALK